MKIEKRRRKKKSRMCFISEYKVVFFPLPIYS